MASFLRKINTLLLTSTLLWTTAPHAYHRPADLHSFEYQERPFDLELLIRSQRRVEGGDILKKIKKEAKRTAKKVEEKTKKVIKAGGDILEAGGDVLGGAGNILEATGNIVTGDKESAKKAMRRLKQHGHDAAKNLGDAGGSVIEMGGDVLIDLPLEVTAFTIDTILNNDGRLGDEVERWQEDVSREIRNGSRKIGDVLEVTIQPENLARIALLYVATVAGGPFAAALVNVMFDKLVLKKDMTEGDMLKSFAIGAAAGYAAQGAQGLVQGGSGAVNTFQHSGYFSRVASEAARTLTTDAGNILANNQSYTTRDFASRLASSLTSVEMGNGFAAQVFEETLETGLQSAATQTVENDFKIKDVNLDQVEMAVYQGLANGLTRESVHNLMDASGITQLAQDGAHELGDFFYGLVQAYQERQQERELILVVETLMEKMSKEESEMLLAAFGAKDKEIRNQAAQKIFGKTYAELSAQEKMSSEFKVAYTRELPLLLEHLVKSGPQFASVATAVEGVQPNPGAKNFDFKLAKNGWQNLQVLLGKISMYSILRTTSILSLILYSPSVGEGSYRTGVLELPEPINKEDYEELLKWNKAKGGNPKDVQAYLDYIKQKYGEKDEGGNNDNGDDQNNRRNQVEDELRRYLTKKKAEEEAERLQEQINELPRRANWSAEELAKLQNSVESRMRDYVKESGLPEAREYEVTRVLRQNREGTLSPEDAFKPYETHRTGDYRYSAEGEYGLYGAVGNDAKEIALLETGMEPGIDYVESTTKYKGRALDLTDPNVQSKIGVTEDQITLDNDKFVDAYKLPQQIGKTAKELGYDAILAPSAKKDDGKTIVVLKELVQ